MKNHIQTIINVCFAICVTLSIYNIDKLNDTIDELNESTYTEDDAIADRIYASDFHDISNLHVFNTHPKRDKAVNEAIDSHFASIEDIYLMIQDLEDKAFNSLDNHKTELNEIKRSIRRLPKPKTTGDVKTIINGCAVPLWNVRADGLAHGHKKLVC